MAIIQANPFMIVAPLSVLVQNPGLSTPHEFQTP